MRNSCACAAAAATSGPNLPGQPASNGGDSDAGLFVVPSSGILFRTVTNESEAQRFSAGTIMQRFPSDVLDVSNAEAIGAAAEAMKAQMDRQNAVPAAAKAPTNED